MIADLNIIIPEISGAVKCNPLDGSFAAFADPEVTEVTEQDGDTVTLTMRPNTFALLRTRKGECAQ